jgi:ribonuclease J
MAGFGISARSLIGTRDVVMLRRALIPDYENAGVIPNADDAYNFSMWNGYLADPYYSEALEWCRARSSDIAHIHTSGHASPADLRDFATALRPKVVVPVHGNDWDRHGEGFGNLKRLADGEQYAIM